MQANANLGLQTSSGNKLRKIDRRCLCCICVVAIFIAIITVIIVLVRENCHREPGVELQRATIRDMAIFPVGNVTNATSWEVASDINLTLSFRNRNSVARCYTTVRKIKITAYYAGNSEISVSQIPFTNLSLNPKTSRVVSAQLSTEHFQMTNVSAGAALAANLRSDNETILLKLKIDTRYLIADRRSFWTHSLCRMIAITPLRSNPTPDFFCVQLRKKEV